MENISRRSFLKGAAAGAASVAALGIAGAAMGAEEQAALSEVYEPSTGIPSFMVPPAAPEAVAEPVLNRLQ